MYKKYMEKKIPKYGDYENWKNKDRNKQEGFFKQQKPLRMTKYFLIYFSYLVKNEVQTKGKWSNLHIHIKTILMSMKSF